MLPKNENLSVHAIITDGFEWRCKIEGSDLRYSFSKDTADICASLILVNEMNC